MKQSEFPEYDKLSQALQEVAEELHPSEIHGLILGLLVGDAKSVDSWLQTVMAGNVASKEVDEMLRQLFEVSHKQLDEALFELVLLLPNDDVDLTKRAEALTLWAQGFLTGLKMTNINIETETSPDVLEAINDMIEIAKMNHEQVVTSEEDEIAFTELVEYVRMSVVMIFDELQSKVGNGSNPHLH